jgi:transketolase C-terminal domain/subunit
MATDVFDFLKVGSGTAGAVLAVRLSEGETREDVVVLRADLAKYTDVEPFVQAFPQRFFQQEGHDADGPAGG